MHAFTIDAPEELVLDLIKINDVSCFGGSDGHVTAQISGGIEPYDIDWGDIDPTMLSAGLYQITVVDALRCLRKGQQYQRSLPVLQSNL